MHLTTREIDHRLLVDLMNESAPARGLLAPGATRAALYLHVGQHLAVSNQQVTDGDAVGEGVEKRGLPRIPVPDERGNLVVEPGLVRHDAGVGVAPMEEHPLTSKVEEAPRDGVSHGPELDACSPPEQRRERGRPGPLLLLASGAVSVFDVDQRRREVFLNRPEFLPTGRRPKFNEELKDDPRNGLVLRVRQERQKLPRLVQMVPRTHMQMLVGRQDANGIAPFRGPCRPALAVLVRSGPNLFLSVVRGILEC